MSQAVTGTRHLDVAAAREVAPAVRNALVVVLTGSLVADSLAALDLPLGGHVGDLLRTGRS
jgi:hypothetical protein